MATLRILVAAVAFFATTALAFNIVFAQSAADAISREVAIAIRELEQDRAAALARIQECEATVSRSQAIVVTARTKGNSQAEQIATAAIKKAEEAKARNENIVKMIDATLKNFKRPGTSPESITAAEKALAKVRIADIRKEIATIQEHLRACIAETSKTTSEREALEKKITEAYDRSWKALQEGLYELGTIGLGKLYSLRAVGLKETSDKAWKIMRETADPNRKAQLLGIIERCQEDGRIVEYNGKLLQHANELKNSHDVYQWDQKESPFPGKFAEGMGVLAGTVSNYYTLGKINYVALSSLNAELTAWHRLREIDQQNAGCSAASKSLSLRMDHKMQESHCLERCLDTYSNGCADRCRGTTALSTPPSLLE